MVLKSRSRALDIGAPRDLLPERQTELSRHRHGSRFLVVGRLREGGQDRSVRGRALAEPPVLPCEPVEQGVGDLVGHPVAGGILRHPVKCKKRSSEFGVVLEESLQG